MNVAAITRYKQGDIWRLLTKLGWSQSELARRTGLHQTRIGEIVNMKRRPNEEQANTIQRAFAEAGEFIDVLEMWPESFPGFGRPVVLEQIKDVPTEMLLASSGRPHELIEKDNQLMLAISTLPKLEREVVQHRYFGGLTVNETGRAIGRTHMRVRQLESNALRHLRRPARTKIIKGESILNEGAQVAMTAPMFKAGRKRK